MDDFQYFSIKWINAFTLAGHACGQYFLTDQIIVTKNVIIVNFNMQDRRKLFSTSFDFVKVILTGIYQQVDAKYMQLV